MKVKNFIETTNGNDRLHGLIVKKRFGENQLLLFVYTDKGEVQIEWPKQLTGKPLKQYLVNTYQLPVATADYIALHYGAKEPSNTDNRVPLLTDEEISKIDYFFECLDNALYGNGTVNLEYLEYTIVNHFNKVKRLWITCFTSYLQLIETLKELKLKTCVDNKKITIVVKKEGVNVISEFFNSINNALENGLNPEPIIKKNFDKAFTLWGFLLTSYQNLIKTIKELNQERKQDEK